ncbi:MAG: hypothetical protein B9S34_05420 [Opitutia bacterium Tous-C1TDCM]|nr:MAG: hypothetical protein B9S34_05420 [Opitutae bacterium Tous-C1TDCM]
MELNKSGAPLQSACRAAVSPEQYHRILESLDQALKVIQGASAELSEQDREFLLQLEILRSRILRAESGHPFPPRPVPTLESDSASPFAALRAGAEPPPRCDRPRLRVLFADDHDSVRSILRALLLAEGDIEIVGEALNGPDAVDQVRATKPDLVIMDLNMPGLDGISATREVLRISPATRVLVFSANRDPASVQKAENAGASGYIFKPATRALLIGALRAVQRGRTAFPERTNPYAPRSIS